MKGVSSLRNLFVIVLLATTLPAATVAQQGNNAHVGSNWARTELFFGTSMPGGGVVSDEQFKAFLDTQITPRFPDGLTVLTGYGQFKLSTGVIQQERSFVLILLYPLSSHESNRRIEEIRTLYKARFSQESVLRADTNNAVSF
jgi:hypothetical protein